jgi:hypothetical protein
VRRRRKLTNRRKAFNLSFNKTPKEKPKAIQSPTKPNNITSEENLNNSPISLIAVANSSEISVDRTWEEEIDQQYIG